MMKLLFVWEKSAWLGRAREARNAGGAPCSEELVLASQYIMQDNPDRYSLNWNRVLVDIPVSTFVRLTMKPYHSDANI